MRLLKRYAFYLVFAVCLIYPLYKTQQARELRAPVFGVLIPSGERESVSTRVWVQAARDEGVLLETVFYDDLMNSFQSGEITSKVLIIPDEASRYAPALLMPTLQKYVKKGGKLVIVGDALTLEKNGRLKESFAVETDFKFPKILERVGDTLQYNNSPVRATREWVSALQIPPGRAFYTDAESGKLQFCTYQSNDTPYPHWITEPAKDFKGQTLIEAKDGSLVAGIQKYGKGEVLWINMPLGYLKKRTDGLFLHSFLRWISEDWVGLPTLLGVPDGVGGLVLNVHVDSNASLPGLKAMTDMGIFKQGPFSIHVTAGPDARTIGDGLGFDLPHNKTSQAWVKNWVKEGHEVGAHGGWIHDYFGKKMGESETAEMADFLEKNRTAVENASGKPVLEYSSPIGNHPAWVSEWISKHGYGSYYFSGNTGMAPTRTFRDENFTDARLWSFPISAYRQFASFEEAQEQMVSAKTVKSWLFELSDFVVNRQTVRLFYFHPPGVLSYKDALSSWMDKNLSLSKEGKFPWYTINQISTFLNAREALNWSLGRSDDSSNGMRLTFSSVPGIEHMVWRFSKAKVKNVRFTSGNGIVRDRGGYFEIQPKDGLGGQVDFEEVSE